MNNDLIKMPGEAGYPEGGYATLDMPSEAGRVRVLCTDAGGDQPVVALVDGECRVYLADGRYMPGDGSIFDLIPLQLDAPAKWRQCWTNWYADRNNSPWGRFWLTEDAAASAANTGATQVHLIEVAAVGRLVNALEHYAAHISSYGIPAREALRAYQERL